jgi:CheY-like chemotaxis protein
MRRDGFDPHEVLLDLARELDEERRHAAELLEFQAWAGTTNRSPGEPASQISLAPDPGEGPKTSRSRASERSTVLLVEDEATVREAVGSALERAGYDVATAESPTEGVTQAQRLFLKPGPLVVVTDLSLPSSNGRSYRGGFELVHRIRRMRRTPGGRRNPVPPAIVLMVERLSRKDRLRTRGLDIEHIVLKPGLSKLDPDEYARDLERLATRTIDAVADCLEFLAARPVPWEKSGPSKPSKQDGPPRDHPYSTATLDDSSAAFLLPRRMLQAAARSSERAVFFVVKEGQARGLLAFGLGGSETADAIAARRLVWDFRRGHGLTEALQTLVPTRLALPVAGIDPSFFARSRTLEGQDAMVLPIPNHGELLALVYVDNPRTGNPLGALQGLGRLAREVGAALEDLGIRRRLRRLAQKMESPNLPVGTAIEVGRGRDGRYA